MNREEILRIQSREQSLLQKFAMLPENLRNEQLLKFTRDQLEALKYDWNWLGRPKQLRCFSDDWNTFLYICGRGWGKSRTGVEWVRYIAHKYPGCYIALVGPTSQSLLRTLIEGESGLMSVCPKGEATYKRGKAQVEFANGSIALMYSADEPDRLRGPNHHFALADEVVAWRYPEAWDMLQFTLRIGKKPQTLVTTTPRPTELILKLLGAKSENGMEDYDILQNINNNDFLKVDNKIIVRGITYENGNLADAALQNYIDMYENTEMGQQELYAKLLLQFNGALWDRKWFKWYHLKDSSGFTRPEPTTYIKTVVAIDPAMTTNKGSDQTAICVASLGEDGKYYVRYCEGYKLTPNAWAEEAVRLYKKYNAHVIVAERNNGGLLVEAQLRQVSSYKDDKGRTFVINGFDLPIQTVHAKEGKFLRAQPISMLYEQGKVIHNASFSELESQMVVFTGDKGGKDDLVDCAVYGLTELSAGMILPRATIRVGGDRNISKLQLI